MLLGFSKVTMDLTRHKLFKQRTRERAEIDMNLNAAGLGTWKWNVEQSRIDISSHLLQLLGYDGDQHVLFDEWLGFVHRNDRARLRGMLEHAPAEGSTSALDTEVRFRGSDRSFRWFYRRAAWHQVDPDEPPVFMGVCVGIDKLKAVDDEKARLFQLVVTIGVTPIGRSTASVQHSVQRCTFSPRTSTTVSHRERPDAPQPQRR